MTEVVGNSPCVGFQSDRIAGEDFIQLRAGVIGELKLRRMYRLFPRRSPFL